MQREMTQKNKETWFHDERYSYKCFLLNTAFRFLQLSSHLLQTTWREAKAILRGGFVKPKATV